MKKVIQLFFAMILCINVYAQRLSVKQVPEKVKTSFRYYHHDNKHVYWEKENGHYEANFKQNNISISQLFDKEGKLLETETNMPLTELPTPIKDFIHKTYKNAKIKEAAKILYPDGRLNYEAEVKGMDLLFDTNYNLVH